MTRNAIPTWFFVLVIVRMGHRVLLVHEREGDQGWYLPAGKVAPTESLEAAALREALEESGVPVVLEHILRIEHTPLWNGSSRVRVIFVARPAGDTPPRDCPNDHTLGAGWFSLEEMADLPLRSGQVRRLVQELERGASLCPISVLSKEGEH